MSAPIDRLLGDPTRCRVIDDNVSIHWYPTPQATACHCGATKRPAPCEHEWSEFGSPGDEWLRCWLCGAEEDR